MKLFRLAAAVMSAAMLFTSCGADTTEPKDYSSRSSAEIVSDMKIGWNLGNTLDVCATITGIVQLGMMPTMFPKTASLTRRYGAIPLPTAHFLRH